MRLSVQTLQTLQLHKCCADLLHLKFHGPSSTCRCTAARSFAHWQPLRRFAPSPFVHLWRWYFIVWLDGVYGDIADEGITIMAWSWSVYWSIQRVSWHICMGSHIHGINIRITYWPGPPPFWGRPLGLLRILIDGSLSEHKYWLSAFSAGPHVGTPGGRGKLSHQPPHPIGVNKATHRSCNQFSIETYNNNKPDKHNLSQILIYQNDNLMFIIY